VTTGLAGWELVLGLTSSGSALHRVRRRCMAGGEQCGRCLHLDAADDAAKCVSPGGGNSRKAGADPGRVHETALASICKHTEIGGLYKRKQPSNLLSAVWC